MVDEETRLDKVEVSGENVLKYQYTLINMTKATVDVHELEESVSPHILEDVQTNPQMAIKVMKIMGKMMLLLQQRLQELISGDVYRRVVRSLIRLAEEYGKNQNGGTFVSLPMTNRDFANMVGTSRESVNRTLNQLKKEKLVDINRKGILIYDLEAFRKNEV